MDDIFLNHLVELKINSHSDNIDKDIGNDIGKDIEYNLKSIINKTHDEMTGLLNNIEKSSINGFNEINNNIIKIENNLMGIFNNHFQILHKDILENYTKLQIESLKMHSKLVNEFIIHCNDIKNQIKKSEDNIKNLLINYEKENLKTKLLISEYKNNNNNDNNII